MDLPGSCRRRAAPRIEVLPHGAIAVSGDGCIAMGPTGVRWQRGIATQLDPVTAIHDRIVAYDMTPDGLSVIGGGSDTIIGILRSGLPPSR